MKHFIASSFKSLLVLLLAVTALWSCQKDLDETLVDNINQIPNLTTKINSSVSGFVVDENNQAVAGASVVVYDKTTTTDDYGYFSVKNVSVVKTAAVVTVKKSGYFPGIKTYIATENKSAFFRIKVEIIFLIDLLLTVSSSSKNQTYLVSVFFKPWLQA